MSERGSGDRVAGGGWRRYTGSPPVRASSRAFYKLVLSAAASGA